MRFGCPRRLASARTVRLGSPSSGAWSRTIARPAPTLAARLLAERHELESDVWLVEPIATTPAVAADVATPRPVVARTAPVVTAP